jgi:hypothetical protein
MSACLIPPRHGEGDHEVVAGVSLLTHSSRQRATPLRRGFAPPPPRTGEEWI